MNKNDLIKAWDNYNQLVDCFAIEIFNSKILPYLKKHNYCFLSGNGTYYIGKYAPNHGTTFAYNQQSNWIDKTDDIPLYIRNILDMPIPGIKSYSLGCIMPDYNPKVE